MIRSNTQPIDYKVQLAKIDIIKQRVIYIIIPITLVLSVLAGIHIPTHLLSNTLKNVSVLSLNGVSLAGSLLYLIYLNNKKYQIEEEIKAEKRHPEIFSDRDQQDKPTQSLDEWIDNYLNPAISDDESIDCKTRANPILSRRNSI
ncbi:MAG: hypothetical protein A2888_00925 [Chlamydiae bacterium RIFCSPLOWO2_01_FULL_28_7]|nr:MAG: hypothetical protein A2888_00925 [Chlamydiae bacterium RIFCSPLOWO2_01_FULL_28_7]